MVHVCASGVGTRPYYDPFYSLLFTSDDSSVGSRTGWEKGASLVVKAQQSRGLGVTGVESSAFGRRGWGTGWLLGGQGEQAES